MQYMHAQKPVSLECFSICLSLIFPLQGHVSLLPHVLWYVFSGLQNAAWGQIEENKNSWKTARFSTWNVDLFRKRHTDYGIDTDFKKKVNNILW